MKSLNKHYARIALGAVVLGAFFFHMKESLDGLVHPVLALVLALVLAIFVTLFFLPLATDALKRPEPKGETLEQLARRMGCAVDLQPGEPPVTVIVHKNLVEIRRENRTDVLLLAHQPN